MGVKRSRFIYCVELALLACAPSLWAQGQPTFTPNPFDSPTSTPTVTFTANPFDTATSTPTETPFGFISLNTNTPTPSSTPTSTPSGTQTPPTATFTPTPGISRASLVLLPTAYSNAWDRWDGFNWDMGFSFYIGSIVSRDFTAKNGLDSLEPTRLALLSTDLKYAWLNDNGDTPGIASGLLVSLLAQIDSGSSGSNDQSFNVGGDVLGGIYTVVSKTIAPKTAVHMGYIYGLKGISDDLKLGIVTTNYSQLPALLTTKLQSVEGESPPSVFYTGFNTYFWGRNWKFEIWKPFPVDQNPVLLNTQIEALPLAFNFGYERWDSGFSVLGYINFQFTLIPTTPDY